MDIERFRNSPIGELVPIKVEDALGEIFEHFAFVPKSLPRNIQLANPTWNALAEATQAIGQLNGEGRRLPNPAVLARPIIRAEAVSSSALEGTYTTLPQVLQSELLDEEDSSDVNEVLRQIRAAELGFGQLGKGMPLGLNLIKEVHRKLMEGDRRYPDNEKGEWRQRQNFIGPRPNSKITEALFVPPPHGEVLETLLFDWESWIHDKNVGHLLVRVAVGHYQFEVLHPFVDGNGRIGRLIAIFHLLHEGSLSAPLLNLSPYLETRRDEYQELMREVSASGDFDGWVRFFLVAVRERAYAGISKVDRLNDFKRDALTQIHERRYRGLIQYLPEELMAYPVLTPTYVRDKYNVTYQAALHSLENLASEEIVDRIQLNSGRMAFIAPKVVAIIQD